MRQLNAGASSFVPASGLPNPPPGGNPQQSGYPQGSYPSQSGYPQGSYPSQGGYPAYQGVPHQGGYPQGGHQGYPAQLGGPHRPAGYPPPGQGYQEGHPPPQGYPAHPPQSDPPSEGGQPQAEKTPVVADPATNPKLRLGGAKGPAIVMPKKKKGGKLDLSQKATPAETTPSPSGTPTAPKDAPLPSGAGGTAATPKEGLTKDAILKDVEKRRRGKAYVRDPRPHFNVVFCGHVDSGKSTISGRLLADNDVIDAREMDKLRREAATYHREGWEYAYVLDLSEEERSKGKTHETGSMYVETTTRRITVLDAPGHKAFVPSMIGGATQADLCVMVISARRGEFETGFEHGGQTREHAILVRTCGVTQLVVVVNKMDECEWAEERYRDIVSKLRPFLEGLGYKEGQCAFFPISGLEGANVTQPLRADVCPWYSGPTVMDFLNAFTPPARSEDEILCLPLVSAYKEDGKVYLAGKCESGSVAVGDRVQLLPSKAEGVVEGIHVDDAELEKCYAGDTVLLRVKGVEDSDGRSGSVLTSVPTTLRSVEYLQVRLVVLEVRNILCAGSKVVMHLHTTQAEVTVHKLLATIDRCTDRVLVKDPTHVKGGDTAMARLEVERPIVAVPHTEIDRMGRFMLRDEGKTIAVGLVTRLYDSTKESARRP